MGWELRLVRGGGLLHVTAASPHEPLMGVRPRVQDPASKDREGHPLGFRVLFRS